MDDLFVDNNKVNTRFSYLRLSIRQKGLHLDY